MTTSDSAALNAASTALPDNYIFLEIEEKSDCKIAYDKGTDEQIVWHTGDLLG